MAPLMTLDEIFASDDKGILSGRKKSTAQAGGSALVNGFEQINLFVDRHGREPSIDASDIQESTLGHRLQGIRNDEGNRSVLTMHDRHGLLTGAQEEVDAGPPSLDDIFASDVFSSGNDIHTLRNVRPFDATKPDEVAQRRFCHDFAQFKPLFDAVTEDLSSGRRKTTRFSGEKEINVGDWFILNGLVAYVAQVGEEFVENGRANARLRVIFSNGTEGNNLRRSLARVLLEDENGRRISNPNAGPLFGGEPSATDIGTGTVYVLASLSEDPRIAGSKGFLHKIGVTGQGVHKRIQNAHLEPSFLMAPVELVAEYTLYNVDRVKLENLLHRVFSPGQADIEIEDRFGRKVRPREWFFVTLDVIGEAVRRIEDGSLKDFRYDPKVGVLVREQISAQ